MDLIHIAAGAIVGLVIGLTGVGGGSLMTPILVLGFGIQPSIAVGTDLLYAAITNYAYQNNWDAATAISGGITFIVYGGEIYGAYRTAKYYQK